MGGWHLAVASVKAENGRRPICCMLGPCFAPGGTFRVNPRMTVIACNYTKNIYST